MKKIRAVLFLCAILCTLLLLFVSCRPNEEQHNLGQNSLLYAVVFSDGYDKMTMPFEITYQSENDYLINNNAITILKSKDELLSLCQDKNLPFFNKDDENFDRKLSRTIRTFDEVYFKDKYLIFILLNEIGSCLPKIDKMAIEQGILTVYISNPVENEADVSAMENTFVCIATMDKDSLKDVDSATVKKVNKGMKNEYEKINMYSDFYSLDYAYNRGIITKNDVRSIGFYQNLGKEWRGEDASEEVKEWKDFVETDYQPLTKTPQEISKETVEKIKILYVELINSSFKYFSEENGMSIKKEVITVKDIYKVEYFGAYNGYIAVALKSSMSLQQITTPTIADTVFYYLNSGEIILLFKDGK